jgi:hypothetical protein
MKHVMFAEKSLLMGDEVADCLLEYARLLGENSSTDTVTIRAISPDGNTIDAAFLLNGASVMLIESTNSTVDPPPNDEAVQYMQDRIEQILNPPQAQTRQGSNHQDYDLPSPESPRRLADR